MFSSHITGIRLVNQDNTELDCPDCQGYVGKLYLGQTWLTGPSSAWSLNITFAAQLEEFKVWDADIQAPDLGESISSGTVRNVSSIVVANKCYNSILYPCQYLHLSFLVR